MTAGLRLEVRDGEDLAVLAAALQDALTRPVDMAYLPRQRRFALVVSRLRREAGGAERVRAGLHFDDVLKVRTQGFPARRGRNHMALLDIEFRPGEDGVGDVNLVFAGGAVARLEVEALSARFSDDGASWPARKAPDHDAPADEPGGA